MYDNDDRPEFPDDGPAFEAGLAEDLATIQKQRDDYLDQLTRLRAEFSNYQKRSKAQADQNQMYAVSGLALDLLAVVDNFERALDAAKSAGAKSIVDGLELVERQLVSTLGKHGVEPIAAVGQPFDPNQHEALMKQPSKDHPEGTVVAELGRGYRLKDRVLRPSKVAIAAGSSD